MRENIFKEPSVTRPHLLITNPRSATCLFFFIFSLVYTQIGFDATRRLALLFSPIFGVYWIWRFIRYRDEWLCAGSERGGLLIRIAWFINFSCIFRKRLWFFPRRCFHPWSGDKKFPSQNVNERVINSGTRVCQSSFSIQKNSSFLNIFVLWKNNSQFSFYRYYFFYLIKFHYKPRVTKKIK